MSDEQPPKGAHILVFPFPAQGHMLPLIDITHQLALQGLTITIIITPKNLPILHPLLSKHPQIQTLVLPFPSHPSVPLGAENVKDIGNKGNGPIISALSQLTEPITHWFNSHPSPPIALLSDFFLGWTHHLANQLGVPRIAFFSSGAFLALVVHYLYTNVRTLHRKESEPVSFAHLPNSPVFPWAHLPSVFRRYYDADPTYRPLVDGMIVNFSSWGCIFNTVEDLEGVYLEQLKKDLSHNWIWFVGPVALLAAENEAQAQAHVGRGGANSVSADDVLTWLDGCPEGSVVYVSFGSQVTLTRLQMEALTAGLEESGTRFILTVRLPTSEQNSNEFGLVPPGFEDRVAGRGLVIKGWALQVSILSHRSVGGFLTHCGWNSVLEGIAAGVVLFAWPMEANQFVNAKLLVEDIGVGVVVCEGLGVVPDSGLLARSIGELANELGDQKIKALELKERVLGAIKEGGSSFRDLNGFVEELRGLTLKKGCDVND